MEWEIQGGSADISNPQKIELEQVVVTAYDEENSTVILIKHGSYVRTIAYWKEKEIEFLSFRPANEDILL